MPFIGNQPADKFLTLEKQVFTTSATDTYTLDREVSSVNDLELFLNNVRQEPTTAYTISGTTLTLASAITASDSMYCVYQGRAVGTQNPATGSVTNDMLSSGSFSNITETGTLTNFTSTGIDDNGTATTITIDSSNNVGINTTSPTGSGQILHLNSSSTVTDFHMTNSTTGSASTDGLVVRQSGLNSEILNREAGDTVFYNNGSERMRIASNGKPFFSTTGTNSELNSTWKFQMRFDGGSDAGLFMASEANGNGTGFIRFNRSSTTSIGQIVRNGTNDSVNYSTTSDYRMKENVIDLSDATTRVKQLQPKRFSWISQESDTPTVDGFLAHEVSNVVPEAVTGTHNEVDEEGNPVYQGIDQSKLVPLLTASLKEAIAKIEELETRIATLEGN